MGFDFRLKWFAFALMLLCCALVARADEPAPPQAIPVEDVTSPAVVDFSADVLPMLRSSCLACHNAKDAKGDLVLETPAAIRKGGETGPAVVPGKGEESLLLKAAARREKPYMPPRANKVHAEPLTPRQLGLLKRWIDQGAKGEASAAPMPTDWRPLPAVIKSITAIAASADGQFAACGRGDQIFLYHLPSRRLVTTLTDPSLTKDVTSNAAGIAHRDIVQSLAFSPDGSLLSSGGYREVKLWQLPQPKVMWTLTDAKVKAVTAVAVSYDGSQVAVAGDDNVLRVYGLEDGKLRHEFSGHGGRINVVQFSGNEERILSGSVDGTVRVWNVATGVLLGRIDAAAPVAALALLDDGTVVTVGVDHVVRTWKLPEASNQEPLSNPLCTFTGHSGPITSLVAVPPAPHQFISGSKDGSLRQWDASDGRQIRQFDHGGTVAAVAVRPDGKRFASAGDNGVTRLWNVNENHEAASVSGERYATELAALAQRKAEYVASEVEHAKKEVEEASRRLGEEKQALARATQARDAAEKLSAQKSDDEEALKKRDAAAKVVAAAEASLEKAAAAVESAKQAESAAEAVQVKGKAEADAAQETAKQAQKPVTSVTFSPDGSKLFTATDDGSIHVWGADAGGAIETLKGHQASVTSLAAGPKGLLVSGSADGTAVVWQLSDQWKLVRTIGTGNGDSPLVGRVLALAFSPDGSILATGGGVPSRSGELKFWSPVDGSLLRDLPDAHSDTVFGLSFSGDGKSLASCAADKLVKVFSVEDGKLFRTFEGHTNHVLGVGFRYDGRAILSGGLDNRLKWWDVQTGEQKGDPNQPPLPAEITSVSYVGFADLALITTGDGRARLLHTDGSIVRDFDAQGAYLFAGAATPDGAYVLAGGQDGVLRLWDGRDGKLLNTFLPH